MSTQVRLEQARSDMHQMLAIAQENGASDLFISAGFPPSMKVQGVLHPLAEDKLTSYASRYYALSVMSESQQREFEKEKECNFALPTEFARFRVNVFLQKGEIGMVIRRIPNVIPSFEELKIPPILKEIVMSKHGLVLMAGSSGSGKSTSLAAMLAYRNSHSAGHIITIEDPIEYLHESQGCMVTQREIGADTHSWAQALKNAMRQAPDVILIGEIRDAETMEQAIAFAESGHLCIATLHATNANKTFDRVINFFPEERSRQQLLMDLAVNVSAVISQRLITVKDGTRRVASEILINTPTMSEIILKGQFHTIKEYMAKSRELGMLTFDQSLVELYTEGAIGYEEAIHNADSKNEVRLNIKFTSQTDPSASGAFEAKNAYQHKRAAVPIKR